MIRRNRTIFHWLAMVLSLSILGWFLYHTVQGEHGWLSMLRLQAQVGRAQETLSILQKQHQELGHRVEMMRPESMDPDLLDEKSREMLDYSKPNEVIILTKPDPAPAGAEHDSDLLQRSKNPPPAASPE